MNILDLLSFRPRKVVANPILVIKKEAEPKVLSFEDLRKKVRNNPELNDINDFLQLLTDKKIVIVLQFPNISLISCTAGKIKSSNFDSLYSNRLVIQFSEVDLNLARKAVDIITDGKPRQHNPPYSIYMNSNREYLEVSKGNENFLEIRAIYLSEDFNDVICEDKL